MEWLYKHTEPEDPEEALDTEIDFLTAACTICADVGLVERLQAFINARNNGQGPPRNHCLRSFLELRTDLPSHRAPSFISEFMQNWPEATSPAVTLPETLRYSLLQLSPFEFKLDYSHMGKLSAFQNLIHEGNPQNPGAWQAALVLLRKMIVAAHDATSSPYMLHFDMPSELAETLLRGVKYQLEELLEFDEGPAPPEYTFQLKPEHQTGSLITLKKPIIDSGITFLNGTLREQGGPVLVLVRMKLRALASALVEIGNELSDLLIDPLTSLICDEDHKFYHSSEFERNAYHPHLAGKDTTEWEDVAELVIHYAIEKAAIFQHKVEDLLFVLNKIQFQDSNGNLFD